LGNREELLSAGLAAGDLGAYERVYELYGPALYRSAERMLGNRADAEDAVQDVFVSLVRSRERIGGVGNLRAYLFVSLRRAIGRIRRRERKRHSAERRRRPPAGSAGPEVSDEFENLRRAVARLPAEQREVVSLKIDGQLTFAQIGEVLGISPNTAASRYRYALEKLRRLLEKDK